MKVLKRAALSAAALAPSTSVYCAHEYTQSNAKFALSVEPDNVDLKQRAAEVDELRARNLPTIPTNIGIEKLTNPFMRPMSTELQRTLDMVGQPEEDVLGETRRRKDNF